MDDLYVAMGIADITPNYHVYLAGYSARKKKSRGVTSQIKVQALIIEQASLGKILLILTYDLLEFGKPEIQTIKDAISKEFQLNPEDIFIAASHTHYAPNMPGRSSPSRGLSPQGTDRAGFPAISSRLGHPRASPRLSHGRVTACLQRECGQSVCVIVGGSTGGPHASSI